MYSKTAGIRLPVLRNTKISLMVIIGPHSPSVDERLKEPGLVAIHCSGDSLDKDLIV